ncbi:MAG: serine hydrolase [Anaerolineae bacterium]
MKRVLLILSLCGVLYLEAEHTLAQDGYSDDSAMLWAQIYAQPEDVEVGCVPLDDPAAAFTYQSDIPFPLASVSKLLIFIEYARRLDAGLIPQNTLVSVATLDLYNLPRTDRGAHDRFMQQYPEGTTQIPLWEVAVGMIRFSSNAAADYLLTVMAPIDWDTLYQVLGVTETGYPHPLTMIPLLMNNHVTGKATLRTVDSLSVSLGESYLDLYVHDSAWRQAEIDYRSQGGSQFPEWAVQTAILEDITVSGTADDFLRVMTAIYGSGGALSDSVKLLVRSALRFRGDDFIDQHYAEYGSKLGFYSGGTLTLVAYGDPLDGGPVISALFFRAIPRSVYTDLLREDAIGDFAHWMNFNACAGLRESFPR